jgi:hypothetical protein
MNPKNSSHLPAPCIVDNGIVYHKADILRLLKGLRLVSYIHRQDNEITNTGEGCVAEVFCDPAQATIVANRSLYLNVHSFDYLELITQGEATCFALVQDNRCLCLTPLPSADSTLAAGQLDAATLEAIVAEALSASWDACLDDERNLS